MRKIDPTSGREIRRAKIYTTKEKKQKGRVTGGDTAGHRKATVLIKALLERS